MTNVWTSLDNIHWEEDARYFYYLHGPMARMEVGHDKVQGSDYYYTIQGWIRGVNAPLAAHNAVPYSGAGMYDLGLDGNTNIGHHNNRYIGLDASAYNLFYYQGDYTALDNSKIDFKSRIALPTDVLQRSPEGCHQPLPTHSRGLFNGNISMMLTDLRGDATNSPGINYMAYQHDALHRIKQSKSFAMQGEGLAANTKYNTNYTYDPNGNLESLKRGYNGLIDDINYGYIDNSLTLDPLIPVSSRRNNNLLYDVNDAISGSAGLKSGLQIYEYDAIGNLKSNANDGVSKIDWSVYGKVEKVEKANGTISYLYDAGDQRLRERNGENNIDTWYIRDPQGNLLALYQKNSSAEDTELRQKEVSLYGSSRLGMFKFQGGREVEIGQPPADRATGMAYHRLRGQKYFECSNHLGNVLTVVTDKLRGIGTTVAGRYEAEVVSYSDYYPFGLEMPGRNGNSDMYRYGFNGKEKDEEGEFGSATHYDYGFRIYNPAVGRFLSVDPLTRSYPWYTPYQFAGNMPIWATDLDGLEPNLSTDANAIITKHDGGINEVLTNDMTTGLSHRYWYKEFKDQGGSTGGWQNLDTGEGGLLNTEYSSSYEQQSGPSNTIDVSVFPGMDMYYDVRNTAAVAAVSIPAIVYASPSMSFFGLGSSMTWQQRVVSGLGDAVGQYAVTGDVNITSVASNAAGMGYFTNAFTASILEVKAKENIYNRDFLKNTVLGDKRDGTVISETITGGLGNMMGDLTFKPLRVANADGLIPTLNTYTEGLGNTMSNTYSDYFAKKLKKHEPTKK